LGEHQAGSTGIFEFFAALPEQLFKSTNFEFLTSKEVAQKHQPIAPLHVPYPISWADEERDLTAWLGNELQNEAFEELYAIAGKVYILNDEQLLRDFNRLQASDHFYYMCTKLFSDGVIHKYFTPYDTPYEAFINYMNVLSDFIQRVNLLTENIKAKQKNILKKKEGTNASKALDKKEK
jgi:alpha-amylase